jgi:hypothetical protein
MHNTQPEQKGTKWMKEQIREAALGMILISVTIFIIWVFAESKWGDWESKLGWAVGIISGVLFNVLIPRPVNPAHFGSPFVKPYHQKPTPREKELMTWLLPKWRQFPRRYFWLASVPYLIVLIILILSTRHKPPYPWMDLATHPSDTIVGFLILTFMGFIPGFSLGSGIFFTHVLLKGTFKDTNHRT